MDLDSEQELERKVEGLAWGARDLQRMDCGME